MVSHSPPIVRSEALRRRALSFEKAKDRRAMRFDPPGSPVAAQRLRLRIALFTPKLARAADAGRAHAEPLAGLAMRQAARDGGKDTHPKIDRQRSRHACRTPSGRQSQSDRTRFGNPARFTQVGERSSRKR